MPDDELTPDPTEGSELFVRPDFAREDFLERADRLDTTVEDLLGKLDLTRTDQQHERMLDAIMGACRAADALRAFARQDLEAASEATESMSYYARRALGEAA
jgi:hypothetical protein